MTSLVLDDRRNSKHDEPKVTLYVCSNSECRAEDRDRGVNPPAPASLICYRCRHQMNPAKIGG